MGKITLFVGATSVVFLMGCATSRVEYRYLDLPEPPVIARPALETQKLVPGDTPRTVIQAHREDILNLQSWGLQLEAALNAFRKRVDAAALP